MIVLNLIQGSEEWHKFRADHDTASEASIVMQCSEYVKRNELIHQKATGSEREFSEWFQRMILDKGHHVEVLARPIIERQYDLELFPVTGKSADYPRLAASFDGVAFDPDTLDPHVTWECKQWNEGKATDVRAGIVPKCDKWQVVQQLVVSRASQCIYTVSDGTEEKTVSVIVALDPADESELVANWELFNEDRAKHQPEPEVKPVTGAAQETLPALRINLTGMVTTSNLQDFKAQALARIDAIKTDLITDQDFADAEVTVKFLKGGEKQLDDAKAKALADTVSIDELFRTVDDLKEQMRQKRLLLEKLVKTEKENRRISILNEGNKAFDEWLAAQESPVPLHLDAGIAESMKGKKSIGGLEDAAADAVASAKIAARKEIDRLKDNLSMLKDLAGEYEYLFSDWAQLIQKDQDFLVLHIKQTIADHQQREQAKLEAERERIRQEEEAKAQALRQQEEARIRAEEQAKARAEAQAEAMRHREEDQRQREEQAKAESQPEEVKQAPEAPKSLEVSALIKKASEIGHPEQVSISKKEYDQLMRDSALLQALIAAGVDNWSGYSDAYAAAFQTELSV